jgi:hypothetical protein
MVPSLEARGCSAAWNGAPEGGRPGIRQGLMQRHPPQDPGEAAEPAPAIRLIVVAYLVITAAFHRSPRRFSAVALQRSSPPMRVRMPEEHDLAGKPQVRA